MTCRKCDTPNPNAKLPDINEIGFKTAMCSFNQAGRCTKGAYCTFAHSEEELSLGRQMQETKADQIPAPMLHEAPLAVQQFLGMLPIKPLPIKQFLAMEPWQQTLIMQRGPLTDSRDPTAVLISRIVTVKKMGKMQHNAMQQFAGGKGGQPQPFAAAAAAVQNLQAPQMRPSGPTFQCVIQPGPLGIGADWASGYVDKVVSGGQGEANGVQVGDWFTKVSDAEYTEGLLDATIALGQPFIVTFTRPEQQAALANDVGQLAASMGMEWALDRKSVV